MKRVYIIVLSIFITTVLLVLNWKFDLLNLSQKESNLIINKKPKKGISSKNHPLIRQKSVIFPLKSVALVIFKQEKIAIFFVTDSLSKQHLLLRKSIVLNATLNGPKLYNDDINLPEGIYNIKSLLLKPTASILLNFPNQFDIRKQEADKRPPLDSKITIGIAHNDIILDSTFFHDFLSFSQMVSPQNTEIIIAPNDFRSNKSIPFCLTCPAWTEELYGNLRMALLNFK